MLGHRVTIIGGSGGMGKIFAKIFKKNEFEVILTARNKDKLKDVANELGVTYEHNLHKSVKEADIVMISIPINSTVHMIEEIAPILKSNALLFDITSLKTNVYNALYKAQNIYPINCISLHPMFGPGIQSLNNYNLIILKVGESDDYSSQINVFLNIFQKEGLKIIQIENAQYHDKMMALVLGTPHMFNILYLSLLKNSNIELKELMKYTGTTFLLQTVFAESIIQREMEMFGEIQIKNNEFHKLLNQFENIVQNYKDIILKEDIQQFKELFTSGKKYSEKDKRFKKSYDYFYEFLKIIKKE
ncbi:MAG: prephenate dehydrogenase/arogenate dehydrogenase family protein [Candidatus Lokiarchaeota archaeon]